MTWKENLHNMTTKLQPFYDKKILSQTCTIRCEHKELSSFVHTHNAKPLSVETTGLLSPFQLLKTTRRQRAFVILNTH